MVTVLDSTDLDSVVSGCQDVPQPPARTADPCVPGEGLRLAGVPGPGGRVAVG